MNFREDVRAFIADPVLQQRPAKYMVLQCFRNSMLEDLHAGISPSSASGDFSDVTVSSPYGGRLQRHPHVHCVVPAGGLSLDHTHWIHPRYSLSSHQSPEPGFSR
jgi:hypothetical protein